MIRFGNLLFEQQYNYDTENAFKLYAETGELNVILDYMKQRNIDAKQLHSNTTVYRGIVVYGSALEKCLPDWNKEESSYRVGMSSWSRSKNVADRYFNELGGEYQSGNFKFLLKYVTTPDDEVYDFNKFKEYRLGTYGWEQEVRCVPKGKVKILKRALPFIEDVSNKSPIGSETYYNLPTEYAKKVLELVSGKKKSIDNEGNVRFGINVSAG